MNYNLEFRFEFKKSKAIRIFATLAFTAFLNMGVMQKAEAQNWIDSEWSYRKSHIITGSSGAGTNYQVRIVAHKSAGTDTGADIYLGTNVLDNFGDVRFTAGDGTTQLDYWLETGSLISGSQAAFWVEIAADLGSDQVLYMYYGNSNASTTSNGNNTFLLFDDFTGSVLDGTKWTKFSGGTPVFSNGLMSVPAISNDPSKIIATGGSTADNNAIGARYKVNGGSHADERAGVGVKTSITTGNGYNYVFHDFQKTDRTQFLDDKRSWDATNYGAWAKDLFYTMESFQSGFTTYGRTNYSNWNSKTWTSTLYTGYPSLNIGSFDSTVTTVWDWAFIRKCIAAEPAHGAWGTQESLSPPLATNATNIETTSFSANWNTVSNAIGYSLDVSSNSNFATFVTGYNNLDVGNVLTKSVTGLTAGTIYYYRVRAYRSNGNSGNSNTITVMPAANGDYRSNAATMNWNAASNWQQFNGTSWVTATASPSSSSGSITIRNGHTVTVTANVSVDQVFVEAGGQVTINSNVTLTLANGTGTDMSVSGTVLTNSTGGNGGFSIISGANLIFNSGAILNYNVNGDAVPTATWAAGSTCIVSGVTNTEPTSLVQLFSNFTWDNANQTADIEINLTTVKGNFKILNTGTGSVRLTRNNSITLTVGGDFLLSRGILNLSHGNGNLTMNVAGNFSITGGTLTESGKAKGNVINFDGSATQVYLKTGGSISNTINFAILSGATVNFGTSVLDGSDGTFILNSGGGIITAHNSGISASGNTGSIQLTGTRTFSTGASYTFNATGAQVTGNGLPLTVNSLSVAGTSVLSITNNSAPASPLIISNILTILSGAKLSIGQTQAVTVNGASNLSGNTCIELNSGATSTASFIDNGVINGIYTAKVNRYITAANWSSAVDGWHLLSSPVTDQPLLGNPEWNPTGTDNGFDFFSFDETVTTPYEYWINLKYNPGQFSTFVVGKGYLVAYQVSGTKSFNGKLNTQDITLTGLTSTAGNSYPGWHLLGNPFASAINWGTGNWTKTNIDAIAQVWDESSSSYKTLAEKGNIIPAMNGFMVHTTGNGTLKIPGNARVHNAANWYKSVEEEPYILLKANDLTGNTSQSSIIRFNPLATEDYDPMYDSYFLAGFAPMFYSTSGNNYLALNTLPEITGERTIPLGFIKNASSAFSIELEESIPGIQVLLEDIQANALHNLSENPVYNFTSDEGDNANRFVLHFSTVGIVEPVSEEPFTILLQSTDLTILTSYGLKAEYRLIDMTGKILQSGLTNGNTNTSINVGNLKNGMYIVSLISDHKILSKKILITK